MLTKSGAKTFFLVGTLICGGSFILLTLDTLGRIPGQTHAENLTEPVKRGKHLWESNNCMGCHTLLGEGAYYAPELTKVYERRGPQFIAAMLKDPEKMYPGQRKMVNYRFNDEQIADLTSFFKWIGEMDLNGFPPKPNLSGNRTLETPASQSSKSFERPLIYTQTCTACHALDGQGGTIGPALDGIGARRDRQFLVSWLSDPLKIKPDSRMPKLPLAEADISQLADFLLKLK